VGDVEVTIEETDTQEVVISGNTGVDTDAIDEATISTEEVVLATPADEVGPTAWDSITNFWENVVKGDTVVMRTPGHPTNRFEFQVYSKRNFGDNQGLVVIWNDAAGSISSIPLSWSAELAGESYLCLVPLSWFNSEDESSGGAFADAYVAPPAPPPSPIFDDTDDDEESGDTANSLSMFTTIIVLLIGIVFHR